ncbi:MULTISPECIES: hypothetical protein [unclassified Halomonas]|uniref:hypothetical protein n=1 Tax=unclassified Halomonas TaxID=2609666 RepID=UPI0006DA5871|nr:MULTISPECIES: hypothetical protein [unclassified Halomonas]KPQ23198.1 MAG: hypothetical protein HLUCCO06_14300 [Halomonas sp. HL-93]SBR51806.1 hypothetical protein GA0071314_3373 [Halomonas sp. HL-93]SNY97522.1 hypothetical protein SAMN04488142_2112 [Halomonas sp. hl-4]
MRLTPWIMPFVFAMALLSAAGVASADEHEPLDDEALEEEYGIKAGSVKRDEENRSSDTSESDSNGEEKQEEEEEEEDTEGGTGGTGSAEDAIEEGESEKSTDDED